MNAKTCLFCLTLFSFHSLGMAEDVPPSVANAPAAAAEVLLAPEAVELNAISDDGRWLLFSSSSDRLVDRDQNSALDAFLLDRDSGSLHLISRTQSHRAANDTSFALAMSADGSRAVFQSRASNLFPADDNDAWDIFFHNTVSSDNLLVSRTEQDTAAAGSSFNGRLSADGRYILFASEAPDLLDLPSQSGTELFRRDLVTGDLDWVSRDLGDFSDTPIHAEDPFLSSNGQLALFVARAWTNGLFLRDMAALQTLNLSDRPVPGIPPDAAPDYSNPVISLDDTTAACRFTWKDSAGFLIYDLSSMSVTAFGVESTSGGTGVPEDQLGPKLSADGSYAAYTTETVSSETGTALAQVFRWNRADQTVQLVSSAINPESMGNGHAFAPAISPDGRYVAFISDATNLTDSTPSPAWRAYLWDGEASTTTLIASLGKSTSPSGWAQSSNGRWLSIAAPDVDNLARIHLIDLLANQTSVTTIEPAVDTSMTGSHLVAINKSGVSADGRYAAVLSLPSVAASQALPQVYLHDTIAGTRQLISQSAEGTPANGWSTPPLLSRDGSRLLYATHANNLAADDENTIKDLILSLPSGPTHQLIRPTTSISAGAALRDEHLQWSPDGRYALVSYISWFRDGFIWRKDEQSWLLDLQTDAASAPRQHWLGDTFSPDGKYLAGSPVQGNYLDLVDVQKWLTAGDGQQSVLWRRFETWMPVFSGDGSVLAALTSTPEPGLLIIDWKENREIFRSQQPVDRIRELVVNHSGRYLAWLLPPTVSTPAQIFRSDTQTGSFTLVTRAADGRSVANADSQDLNISADGRYIAFSSAASNLVPDDDNNTYDVFLRDMKADETLRLSLGNAGQQLNAPSSHAFFSPDGNTLFFISTASDAAPGDLNQGLDLFKISIQDGIHSGLLAVIRQNLTTGQVDLLWNGQLGKTYRVQFKETVNAALWQDIATVTEQPFQVPLDPAVAPHRFFRVIEE